MKFKDIIGLEKTKKHLIQTVTDNRISHTQLFLGQKGSGNLALAIAYAQYINCTNKQNNDSCGTCASCIKFEKLIHPDLHFIFPVAKLKGMKDASSQDDFFLSKWREISYDKNYHFTLNEWYEKMGIENKQGSINTHDAKSVVKTLMYKSYESEYKIMLIWMPELLHISAAPRLLKIIEEPPKKTLFLLVAESTDKIIKTILSRAQIVKIPNYNESDIEKYFSTKTSPQKAKEAAYLANGSIVEARRVINVSETEKYYFESFRKWMRSCFKADFLAITDFVNEISKQVRERQKSFLHYSLKLIRYCIIKNYSGDELIRLAGEEKKFVSDFSPFINDKNVEQLYEEINTAMYYIERNAKSEIVFTNLSIKITKLIHAGKK
ncbi:MAG: DNA polymerase III subunit delta [Bacteroidota bacterium]|nr:DNA polymerase III subunit delta [Bacteroidota bacterium]